MGLRIVVTCGGQKRGKEPRGWNLKSIKEQRRDEGSEHPNSYNIVKALHSPPWALI